VSEVALTITIKPKLVVKPTLTALKLEVTLEELAISTLASAVKVTTEDGREATIEPLSERALVLKAEGRQHYERWVRVVAKGPFNIREVWRDNRNEFIVTDALYVM
jgi:hypothetical protein